ncbi:hypothetical protein TTHERM_00999140 (macronuclear) [Tetrahymena thermophila SB210]|uniref:Uncharacterized protein n=1 Tax=Tetrahymena thermophila (strain SB210) TaxID=312017 RepID=Q22D63_TETTS|nr:hypothetical protein TTHERM_00999140 [Tetrahymena thermophila SB210]EAR83262.2 hypothetical protein TTHERM_00999140 [Tetrahymena thermophila SB210]|eukprot:XP_001030925.2 hypothetical protein TTHERM_00999140 [Tetrahymena thermophila SB210]
MFSESFNNYPHNKIQAWKELNQKISQQINIMLKKKITEQKEEAHAQLLEERKQREEIHGQEDQKLNYVVFSTAKRRSVSTDDLKMTQIMNKFQYNLNQAPKKSILKLHSSYKQNDDNIVKTDRSSILLRYNSVQKNKDNCSVDDFSQSQTQHQTPENQNKLINNTQPSQNIYFMNRPSSSSERKFKKKVQFSDTIRKLKLMYEDQNENNSSKSQIIYPNKIISQANQHDQQQNIFQNQMQIKQQVQQQNYQKQNQQNELRPFTIQSYRSSLSTKLFLNQSSQAQIQKQQHREEETVSKNQLNEKIQIMDINFRERLQKKLNQALKKKEELKQLQQAMYQPLQIQSINAKQGNQAPVQYIIKLPSKKINYLIQS